MEVFVASANRSASIPLTPSPSQKFNHTLSPAKAPATAPFTTHTYMHASARAHTHTYALTTFSLLQFYPSAVITF